MTALGPSSMIDRAAAEWDARLRSPHCSDADRAAFKRWQDADPGNAEAFERLQQTLDVMRLLGERPQVRAMRDDALHIYQRGHAWRRVGGMAIAASAALAIGVGAITLFEGPTSQRRPNAPPVVAQQAPQSTPIALTSADARLKTYETAANERTEIGLDDGSTVALNASTRMLTLFSPSRRDVQLLRGQALFRVMKDTRRPFVVRAGNREVIAVGTAFEVRVDPRSLNVTLLEGKVTVKPIDGAAAAPEVHLLPNQQLTLAFGGQALVRAVDTAPVAGWSEGRVYFDDTPLDAAIAEMNRYSAVKIDLGDPSLARYRVSGVFRTGSQASFVEALEAYFPIASVRDGQTSIRLERAQARQNK